MKYLKNDLNSSDSILFNRIVNNLTTYNKDIFPIEGLYDRGHGESRLGNLWYKAPEKRREISHDNLTAIAVFSNFFNKPYAKDIAKHFIKWQGRFDNCYPEKPRWKVSMKWHPRDWFCYLWHGGGVYRFLSYPWFPIFFGACVFSCLSKYNNTSGKLLWFVRLVLTRKKSFFHNITWFFYKRLMKRKYGDNWLHKLVCIYFKHPDHPLRELSKDLIF